MIRGVLFTAVYYLLSAVCVLLSLPAMLLPGERAVRGLVRLYMMSMRLALHWVAGIRTDVRGKHNLPDGPFIVAAKHQSWGDGFMIYPEVNNLVFVTGDHLEKFPLVGRILNKLGAIVIDTCGGGQRKAQSLTDGVEKAKADGRRILIYPEGHLAPPGHHFTYKPGVWHMQQAMNVPVVPVATNLGCFWKQQSMRKQPGKAVIEFLEPIPPGDSKASFMARLTEVIETASQNLIAEANQTSPVGSILTEDPVKGTFARPPIPAGS